jgi:two-component system nitrate/nitrite response regulator NarL
MVDAIFAGNARISEIDEANEAELVRPAPPPVIAPTVRNEVARRVGQPVREAAVIIVENNLVFRAGLVHVLADTQFRVVAECSSLAQIPPAALEEDDCILLISLGRETLSTISSELTRLHDNYRGLRVAALCDDLNCKECISQLGNIAHAYFLKSEIGPDFILRSLEMVLLGATIFPRQLFEEMLIEKGCREPGPASPGGAAIEADNRRPLRRPEEDAAAGPLSGRERCILSHIMSGASNKHIARELGITEATVKVHVKNMLLKINAKNRTQAAMWGMKYQMLCDK